MPFLLAEILNFQGSTHHIGVGSFSKIIIIIIIIFIDKRIIIMYNTDIQNKATQQTI